MKIIVYNPHHVPFKVPARINDIRGWEVIPPFTWKTIIPDIDTEKYIGEYNLICFGCREIPEPPEPTHPDVDSPQKEHYEELWTVTGPILDQGFFETQRRVPVHHWDSTEFIPVGGPQLVYGIHYTLKNVKGRTLVIFDKDVPNGPSEGVKHILSINDQVSFRYSL